MATLSKSTLWGVAAAAGNELPRPVKQRVSVVVAAARGGGRGGGNDRNWGRGSGTLSRDYNSGSNEYDSGSSGRDGGRGGRGSSSSYRGRGSSSYRGRGSSSSYRGRGSYRGSGRGRGGGRYDAMRRAQERKMHEGAFEVVDEETGEKVVVWGLENADDVPEPSKDDLQWKPSTMAFAGDVSDEGWYKAMEASMDGAAGAFSVKGVRQGGVYNDEEDEEVEEDDLYESDYDEEDDEEPAAALMTEEEEAPAVKKPMRATRLRVFGRDFKQKEILKSEETQQKPEETQQKPEETQQKPEEAQELTQGLGLGLGSDTTDELEQSWPPAGHHLTTSASPSASPSPSPSYTPSPSPSPSYTSSPSPSPSYASSPSPSPSYNSLSSEEEVIDEQWPPVGTVLSSERDTQQQQASTSSSYLSRSKQAGWRDVRERVVREEDWKQGGMNPGIIDIDEDEDDDEGGVRTVRDRKQQPAAPVVRSNLLDELRLQTHRKRGTKAEEVEEEPQERPVDSKNEEEGAVTVMKPRGFRDLKARSNYDPSLAAEFFSTKSFKDVGASEEVIAALKSLQLRKPSAIQAMAFKPILGGQSCIVADQTGSGKTLAYLSPLVQMLRAEEAKGGDTKNLNKKPRVLVLVPTSELAVQVLNVCRAFSRGGAPFRSLVLTGGFKWKTQVESLAQGADIVVATPGRFLQHLEKGSLKLDNLKTVVLDEVDILYDDQEFTEVLQTLDQAASQRVQYVHVTATLPLDIHDSLLTRYPDAIPLMGPTLHRTAVGLQEVLVDCSGAEGEDKTPEKAFLSKKAALLQLVDQRPVSKTIVFCNKIETCRDVENALQRHDRSGTKLAVLPYHAALSQEVRQESMQQFLESQPSKSLFLVCTDRASRGLDSFDVEHVVLFDFPRDPSEYVRRVGRTARGAGGTGKVFVFALGKQVAMARRIMARNEKGRPIHDIPGSAYET